MKKKQLAYSILNLLITMSLLVILYWRMDFIPFGGPEKRSLLTIDLGQQYIDFFSLFRQALLKDPRLFLYSFQKGIGGEMMGLWAYYLLSPFNLMLLFFKEDQLDLAVTFLTMAKLMAASASFYAFSVRKYQLSPLYHIALAQCYAFMSYVIVFQLNIMWLDGVILLPLIALGLDRFIKGQSHWLYTLTLTLALMTHYYIGYMICLFQALYAVYVILEQDQDWSFKSFFKQYCRFIYYSFLAGLTAAIILLPTFLSMLTSKGAWTGDLLNTLSLNGSIMDHFSKLFIGSFVYDELSGGTANIYVGMLPLVSVLLYALNPSIRLKEKLIAGLILLAFYLSFSIDLLNKIWHMGQFPIWYDHRFSFTFSFFILVLAGQGLAKQKKPVSLVTSLIGLCLMAAVTFIYFQWGDYDYLTPEKLFLSLAFFVVILVILQLSFLKTYWRQLIILGLTLCELGFNAIYILDEVGHYVQPSQFHDYITLLDHALEKIRPKPGEFYRIHKTFQRTKNEAFFRHYPGLDHFGSTLEQKTSQLYAYLGLAQTTNSINYTSGTLFTDDLFDVRYVLDVAPNSHIVTKADGFYLYRSANDLDLHAYPKIARSDRYLVYENRDRLGFAFEVSNQVTQASFEDFKPIANQETLLRLINFDGYDLPFYQPRAFTAASYDNLQVTDKGDGDFYTYEKVKPQGSASFSLTFQANQANPYYFTFPSQYSNRNVKLAIDGKDYDFYTPADGRQVLAASFDQLGQHSLTLTPKKNPIKANLIQLYEFDYPRYQTLLDQKKSSRFQVTDFKENQITGTVRIQQRQGHLLFALPYDRNWKVKVDGQTVKPLPVLNETLMAIPIDQGDHTVELTYFPNSLIVGFFVSLLGLVWQGIAHRRHQAQLAGKTGNRDIKRPTIWWFYLIKGTTFKGCPCRLFICRLKKFIKKS